MLTDDVARFIADHRLMPPGARVLVGLSGGVDSVVLLDVLLRLGYAVRAAHVNFALRGEASDGDEAFVRSWCAGRGVPLAVARFDTRAEAAARGLSVQETARVLRYDWFAERAAADGCPFVAVAHHLDDQAETVLLQLFRGSGPEGLAGMPVARSLGGATLVRPLLVARRAAIEAYARAAALPWRDDASNLSPRYRRTAVREHILPLAEAHFGAGVYANVARAAALMRDYVAASLHPALAEAFAGAGVEEEQGGSLVLERMRAAEPVWQRRLILEALRRWLPGAPGSFTAAETVAALIDAQPGRRVAFAQGTVWRERGRLRFVPAAALAAPVLPAVLEPGVPVRVPGGTLLLTPLEALPGGLNPGTPDVAFVDAGRLAQPLTVRPWRDGDRFRPLGMQGTKKVSDYLTDARVPPHRRRDVCVVCSGEEIVWLAGCRIDHRYRIREETQAFAKISFLRAKTEEGDAA